MIYELYSVERTIHERAYEENERTYYELSYFFTPTTSWIGIKAFLKAECEFEYCKLQWVNV